MRLPLVGRLRGASRKRAFLQKNSDIRRVFGAWEPLSKNNAAAAEPLSPGDIKHWDDYGFLVLRGFFDQSAIEDYKRHIDNLWQTRSRPDNPLVIFSSRGGHYFRDATEEDRSQTYRLLDQYLFDTPTRDLIMRPRLVNILSQLMGHDPVVCNSLLFEWGSEQDMHSDLFYMASPTENQMLATWLALDDVTDDNGPLLYVPGSHKLPPHRFSNGRVDAITEEVPDAVALVQEKMAELGLKTEKFLAKRGDVLIWHSQLVHGGDSIRDHAARRASLVTHYHSTCDVPRGRLLCAERQDGSLLMVRDHVRLG